MSATISERKRPKVVIVGAGAGGIATAARLARAGIDVIVLEKNSFPGGRCSLIYHEDYRFDQGPSLLLLPGFVYSTFDDLGTSLDEEEVKLYKCEPNYKVYYHDRNFVTLSTDQSLMKHEMEKWEGSEGYERFLAFLQESHRHYDFSINEVLNTNFPTLCSLLRPHLLAKTLRVNIFRSVYSRASQYFLTERLRRAFTFSSMYMGMSPYDAPGIYSLLQYTELTEGVWYPKGGFHKILETLMTISKRDGAIYRLSTPVDKVLVSNGKATGVRLSSGEDIQADIVVLNSDLVYSYQNLLPHQPPTLLDIALSLIPLTLFSRLLGSTRIGLKSRDVSCSSISFYWGMNRIIPEFGPHNIFLAEQYQESFDDIFKSHTLPKEPSFYVNVPSRIDPTAAPEGKDTVVVLVPIGVLSGEGKHQPRMEDLVERARDFAIDRIEKQYDFKDFRQWISFELINTPETWREKFNLDRGAILGLSHDFLNVLCFRPPIRHSSIKNLFFVGASTHPGTGVPVCLAGAKLTSELILSDLGINPPWRAKEKAEKAETEETISQSKLDQLRVKYLTASDVWDAMWQCLFFLCFCLVAISRYWNRIQA